MNTPTIEAIKEIYRWFWSFVLARTLEGLLGLFISALPFFPVNIFPETFIFIGIAIPFRMFVSQFVIPAIIRGLDKYKYIQSKERGYGPGETPKGIIGFNLLNDWN